MVGIVSTYKQVDWEADMRLAKSKEITGFALNIGVDPYNEEQLDLAYAAADVVGFDLFISFDFNWYKTSDVSGVVSVFKRYASHPRQLKVDGKPFVSTFIGDGFDWSAVEKEMGMEIYSVPFYQPSKQVVDTPSVSGLFSW
jgi:glucan endo-1,3-alpha-glucosidase